METKNLEKKVEGQEVPREEMSVEDVEKHFESLQIEKFPQEFRDIYDSTKDEFRSMFKVKAAYFERVLQKGQNLLSDKTKMSAYTFLYDNYNTPHLWPHYWDHTSEILDKIIELRKDKGYSIPQSKKKSSNSGRSEEDEKRFWRGARQLRERQASSTSGARWTHMKQVYRGLR